MKIENSVDLLNKVKTICARLRLTLDVKIQENPERDNLPCVGFGPISIWKFPSPEKEVWCADYCKHNHRDGSNDVSDIFTGDFYSALKAGLKVYLDEQLSGSIENEIHHDEWEASEERKGYGC